MPGGLMRYNPASRGRRWSERAAAGLDPLCCSATFLRLRCISALQAWAAHLVSCWRCQDATAAGPMAQDVAAALFLLLEPNFRRISAGGHWSCCGLAGRGLAAPMKQTIDEPGARSLPKGKGAQNKEQSHRSASARPPSLHGVSGSSAPPPAPARGAISSPSAATDRRSSAAANEPSPTQVQLALGSLPGPAMASSLLFPRLAHPWDLRRALKLTGGLWDACTK